MYPEHNRTRFNRYLVVLGFCLAWAGLASIGSDLFGLAWSDLSMDLQVRRLLSSVRRLELSRAGDHRVSDLGMVPIAVPRAEAVGEEQKAGQVIRPEWMAPESEPGWSGGLTRSGPLVLAAQAASTPAPAPTPVPTLTAIPTPAPVPEMPVRLQIPDIVLDAPVEPVEAHPAQDGDVDYLEWTAPDAFAAGWHTSSARLGEVGNTVLNGHHNINGRVFAHLVDLEEGALIRVQGESRTYEYQVTQKLILPEKYEPVEVRLENAHWIMPTQDERLTLVTCWPQESNTHRLIIVAQPLGP